VTKPIHQQDELAISMMCTQATNHLNMKKIQKVG